jgi:hypothetical protein
LVLVLSYGFDDDDEKIFSYGFDGIFSFEERPLFGDERILSLDDHLLFDETEEMKKKILPSWEYPFLYVYDYAYDGDVHVDDFVVGVHSKIDGDCVLLLRRYAL